MTTPRAERLGVRAAQHAVGGVGDRRRRRRARSSAGSRYCATSRARSRPTARPRGRRPRARPGSSRRLERLELGERRSTWSRSAAGARRAAAARTPRPCRSTRKSVTSIPGGSGDRCSRRTFSPARPAPEPPASTVASRADDLAVLGFGAAPLLIAGRSSSSARRAPRGRSAAARRCRAPRPRRPDGGAPPTARRAAPARGRPSPPSEASVRGRIATTASPMPSPMNSASTTNPIPSICNLQGRPSTRACEMTVATGSDTACRGARIMRACQARPQATSTAASSRAQGARGRGVRRRTPAHRSSCWNAGEGRRCRTASRCRGSAPPTTIRRCSSPRARARISATWTATSTPTSTSPTCRMFGGYGPEPVVEAVADASPRASQFLLPNEDSIWVAEELRPPLSACRSGSSRSSATHANTEAIRVARDASPAATQVLFFDGKYHGHFDEALVELEDGRLVPEEAGLPADVTSPTDDRPVQRPRGAARGARPRDVADRASPSRRSRTTSGC